MRYSRPRIFIKVYIYRRRLFVGTIVSLTLGTLWLFNLDSRSGNFPMVDSSRHLPLLYWYHRSTFPKAYRNFSCTRAPSPRRIKHVSPFWQLIKNPVGNVIASSAFWDERFGSSYVRVLVYSDQTKINDYFCQVWYFNRKDPVTVRAQDINAWRDENVQPDEYNVEKEEQEGPIETIVEPHILTCNVPNDSTAPAAVSLVTDQCDGATNLLRVQGAPIEDGIMDQVPGIWTGGKMRNLPVLKGVCVCAFLPPHDRDVSARVAEWMELLKHFGVEMIYLYVTTMHPNVRHVIDHYQWIGLVDVSFFSVPFAETQKENIRTFQEVNKLGNRKKQQVIYNDCLYRAIGWHQWIVLLRLDDLLVPLRDGSLVKLAQRELDHKLDPPDALSFSTFRFTPRATDSDDPNNLKILDHQWRMNEEFSDDWNIKYMNRIDTVIAIQEYRPLWCGGGIIRLSDGNILERDSKKHLCEVHKIDSDAARIHAYGASCKNCENLFRDTTMQRWRHVSKETDELLRDLIGD